tara:strand:- start:3856 stop:4533 length:678 start_codon:yes stop_codon:yes gene_type:complete
MSKSYRYERKFFITDLSPHEVKKIVNNSTGLFREIYTTRYINNIYFDYYNFSNYWDNNDGLSQRIKPRVRWYGSLLGEVQKPILEYKIKRGMLGRKERYNINDFLFNNGHDLNKLKSLISDSDFDNKYKEKIINQNPVLVNRYKRKYFQSLNKKFRITIDTDLSYLPIKTKNLNQKYKLNESVILEIKYDEIFDNEANQITQCFPFRLTKCSKYSIGIEKSYHLE